MPGSARGIISMGHWWAVCFVLGAACSLSDFDRLSEGGFLSPAAGSAGALGGGAVGGSGGAAGSSSAGGAAGTGSPSSGAGGEGGAPPLPVGNLIENSSFEDGHSGWIGFGESEIVDVTENPHTGERAICSQSRADTWTGPSYRLLSLVRGGVRYSISAWARVDSGTETVGASTKTVCLPAEGAATEEYTRIVSLGVGTDWTEIRGQFLAPSCDSNEFLLYFEGPAAGAVFYLDDVEVLAIGE